MSLERDGFVRVAGVLEPAEVAAFRTALAPWRGAGVRDLAAKVPDVARLASSPTVWNLVAPVLGGDARLVRSICFDKRPDANWHVAWHQDLAIAVAEHADVPGFVGASVKDGVPHVQPPVSVLEAMLTVRLHLDDTDAENGALEVVPGSHRLGRIPADAAAATARRLGAVRCDMAAGDALLLRPLLLHASSKSVSDRPRRVVHLEFAAGLLPPPLRWHTEERPCCA